MRAESDGVSSDTDKPNISAPFPMRPPWPPPAVEDLAQGAIPPTMDDSRTFVRDMATIYGDDPSFSADRWRAGKSMLTAGDFRGLISGEAPEAERSRLSRNMAAWLLTPREAFIPKSERASAYGSFALPVGHGQTISAPYMVTRMTAALNPAPNQRVLEIGTGSGYQAAVLAALCSRVHTIEYVGPLAAESGKTFDRLAEHRPWIANIRRRTGNGYRGWEDGESFDRIIVTCAIDHLPPALLEQLAPGGIMVIPLGSERVQSLIAIRRRLPAEASPPDSSWQEAGDGSFDVTDVYGDGTRVVFVPFVH